MMEFMEIVAISAIILVWTLILYTILRVRMDREIMNAKAILINLGLSYANVLKDIPENEPEVTSKRVSTSLTMLSIYATNNNDFKEYQKKEEEELDLIKRFRNGGRKQ